MSKRINLVLSDEEYAILQNYCQRTGASKTGAFRFFLDIIKDERLLAIVRKLINVD